VVEQAVAFHRCSLAFARARVSGDSSWPVDSPIPVRSWVAVPIRSTSPSVDAHGDADGCMFDHEWDLWPIANEQVGYLTIPYFPLMGTRLGPLMGFGD